jgi:hypothetical protein
MSLRHGSSYQIPTMEGRPELQAISTVTFVRQTLEALLDKADSTWSELSLTPAGRALSSGCPNFRLSPV